MDFIEAYENFSSPSFFSTFKFFLCLCCIAKCAKLRIASVFKNQMPRLARFSSFPAVKNREFENVLEFEKVHGFFIFIF